MPFHAGWNDASTTNWFCTGSCPHAGSSENEAKPLLEVCLLVSGEMRGDAPSAFHKSAVIVPFV